MSGDPRDPRDDAFVLDVIGPERGGKSDFACSVAQYDRSGPAHYLAFDYNFKGPVARHTKRFGSRFDIHTFFYSLPFPPPEGPKVKDFEKKVNAIAAVVRPVWSRFKDTLWKLLDAKSRGPIIMDNWTTLHYVCRLALYGYVHKIPRFLYAKRTNEMSTILNQVRFSGKNVVLIHRWAEIWDDNDRPTGEFERAGAFKPVAYEVMATLAATRDSDSGLFQVEILDSTFNNDTHGLVLKGKRRTFRRVVEALVKE